MRYQADITAGSLKIAESRVLAALMLEGLDSDAWRTAIEDSNVLRSRNRATAIRVSRLVRKRLELMNSEHWLLVRDGVGDVTVHALMAAAIKHSALLGDFLDLTVRDRYRSFAATLPKSLWDEYLQGCRERDPEMPIWNESTRRKLGTTVYHMLQQAGYLENTRTLKLRSVHVAEPVIRYLERYNERYVLRCMQVCP